MIKNYDLVSNSRQHGISNDARDDTYIALRLQALLVSSFKYCFKGTLEHNWHW